MEDVNWRDYLLTAENGRDVINEFTTEDMENSILNNTMNADNRIKNIMLKAKQGKPITIAYVGGSITHGYSSATPLDAKGSFYGFPYSYASTSANWWKNLYKVNNFNPDDVNVVNIGIPSSDSLLGAHRVYSKLQLEKPDLIVLEYNVNDGASSLCESAYNSLIKKCLTINNNSNKNDNSPAVISLVLTAKDDYSMYKEQDSIKPTNNFHYDLSLDYNIPIISYKHMLIASLFVNYFDDLYDQVSKNSCTKYPVYNPTGHSSIFDDATLYTCLNTKPNSSSYGFKPYECEPDTIDKKKIHIESTLPYWEVTTQAAVTVQPEATTGAAVTVKSEATTEAKLPVDSLKDFVFENATEAGYYQSYFDNITKTPPTAELTIDNVNAKQIILYSDITRNSDKYKPTYGTFEVYVDDVLVAQKLVKPGDGINYTTPRIVDREEGFNLTYPKVNRYLLNNGNNEDNSFIFNESESKDNKTGNHKITIKCYGDCQNLRFIGLGVSGLSDSKDSSK